MLQAFKMECASPSWQFPGLACGNDHWFISSNVLPLAVFYNVMPKRRRSYTWHLNNWVILSEVGWIDSLNLNVNIFINCFLNWCIYDCSMPVSPLSVLSLSEIEKMKSWPYAGTGTREKAKHEILSEIQTALILHAKCMDFSILVRVLCDVSLGMENAIGQLVSKVDQWIASHWNSS